MSTYLRNFERIRDLAATRHQSTLGIYVSTFSMIFTATYEWATATALKGLAKTATAVAIAAGGEIATVTEVPVKGSHTVNYKIAGKPYTFFTKIARGPKKIARIKSHAGEDITSFMEPYMGPYRDFHGGNFTPLMLNLHEVHIEYTDSRVVKFSTTETIK